MKRIVSIFLPVLLLLVTLGACAVPQASSTGVLTIQGSSSAPEVSSQPASNTPPEWFDEQNFDNHFFKYFSDPYFSPIDSMNDIGAIEDEWAYENYGHYIAYCTYLIGAERGVVYPVGEEESSIYAYIPTEILSKNSLELLGVDFDYSRIAPSERLSGFYDFSREGYIGLVGGYGRWCGTAHNIDFETFIFEGNRFSFDTYVSELGDESENLDRRGYYYTFEYVVENELCPYRLVSILEQAP